MTVSYQYDVASSTSGGFTRLLFKWQGSLYKLIYNELILFCCAYGVMSAIYRFVFTQHQKRVFEQVAFYCDTYMNYIPLSFILGFYVSFVASRWWQQYMAIPWPDKMLHALALYLSGNDEKGRLMRRTLVRYLNLSLVLVLRSISSAVKKRFPTLEHLVEAGFISNEELAIYNITPNKEFNTYWIPCTWFTALLREARVQKRLTDPLGLKLIMEEFCEFRQKCGLLWSYDWVSIPLVYTQVVTIATYSFFIAAIIGRQFVEKSPIPYKKMIDLYCPFFTLLQFFFYMGLLKVAEQLINPFGDDDEDFELNWIIDRHIKVSYLIVDTLTTRIPTIQKDIFFDEVSPELPYTAASAEFKKEAYRGSVANMVVPEEKQNLILPDILEEGEEQDEGSLIAKSNLKHSCLSLALAGLSSQNNMEHHRDGRSLSVPEMQHPNSSSTAISSRGSSFRSAVHTKTRRPGTAGSKGYAKTHTAVCDSSISSALIVLGSNQAVMGADPSTVEKSNIDVADEFFASSRKRDSRGSKAEDELDYLFFPFRDVYLDIDDGNFDTSTDSFQKFKDRTVSWMQSSLQAKLAMKKKPVIKWKPYHRPVQSSANSGDLSSLPPGVFEDECAFMWTTIDEETDSLKTVASNSALSEDFKLVSTPTIEGKGLSYYSEIKLKSPSRDTEDTITDSSLNLSNNVKSNLVKTSRAKRTRYKFKGRTRHAQCAPKSSVCSSMPYLPICKCGQKAITSKLLNSISESSIFIETVANKIEALQELHARSSRYNNDLYIPPLNSLNRRERIEHSRTVGSERRPTNYLRKKS